MHGPAERPDLVPAGGPADRRRGRRAASPALVAAVLLALAALAVLAGPAGRAAAATGSVASVPSDPPRAYAGQADERWGVGGTWLRRLDATDDGRDRGYVTNPSTKDWSRVRLPDVWNAKDDSVASMVGGVAWYRRDLRLPKAPKGGRWIVRFEDVRVQGDVFLNGKPIGSHRGSYAPFELELPSKDLKRTGINRLVVRTDNRKQPTDFPPLLTQADGTPGGGFWNDGGIPREVTLRRASEIDLSPVQITPDLKCATCSGRVEVRATATNVGPKTRTTTVAVTVAGKRKVLGRVRIPKGKKREVRGVIGVAKPKIWSPKRPSLYRVEVDAEVDRRPVATYRAKTGIRSIRVVDGRLQLNFKAVNLRGFGFEEQGLTSASALSDKQQDTILNEARTVGGLVLRAHYPLDPRFLEEADRRGFLVWNEIPVFQNDPKTLGTPSSIAAAQQLIGASIQNGAYHPSIFTWSVGNELSSTVPPSIRRFFLGARAAVDANDTTRPTSYAHQAAITQLCVVDYSMFQLIGINDYFGWYGTPPRPLSNPANVGPYLDKQRQCAPQQAVMITETGSEANRPGAANDRGSYGFQQAYAAYHFATYRSRPWLSGALYWALRDFRVRPGWAGGNPTPDPPIFHKAPFNQDGTTKPLWSTLRSEFRGVDQLAPAPTTPVTIPPSPPGPTAPQASNEGGDAGTGAPAPTPAPTTRSGPRTDGSGAPNEGFRYQLRDQESGTDK